MDQTADLADKADGADLSYVGQIRSIRNIRGIRVPYLARWFSAFIIGSLEILISPENGLSSSRIR